MSSPMIIPHSKPTPDETDILSVSDVFRTGDIAQGNLVEKLVEKF